MSPQTRLHSIPQISLLEGWNSDLGNARIMADILQDEVRYDAVNKQWFTWDDTRFILDDSNVIYELATRVPDILLHYARDPQAAAQITASNPAGAQALVDLERWSERCRSRARITAMVDALSWHEEIQMPPRLVNNDPNLLNTQASIVNLESGTEYGHITSWNMTKVTNAGIGDQAQATNWLATLKLALHDQELIDYFQRAAGYTLTGHVTEQCFFFLYGSGKNGKSTIVNALAYALGNYARKISVNTISLNTTKPYELADLDGIRMVYTSETEQGNHLAESFIKDFTGGDKISVERKFGHPYEMQPVGKIWIAGNHKPRIRGTDDGIWRRVHLIPFTRKIPADQIDLEMPYKLQEEADHILAWALEGYRQWQKHGLMPPPVIDAARKAYKREEDTLGEFWLECIHWPDPLNASATLHKDLYTAYCQWCEDNKEKSESSKALASMLDERGVDRSRGKPLKWQNLALSSDGHKLLQKGQKNGF